MHHKYYVIIMYLLILTLRGKLSAQSCPDDYYAVDLPTPTVQNISTAAFTAQSEIIFTGTVLRKNSVLIDGWLTKVSSLGTVIWSKRYSSGVYNDIRFSKVVPVEGSNYIVGGNIGMVDTSVNPPAQLTQVGILLKMDKYGNIIWSKTFSKDGVSSLSTTIDEIIIAGNGDMIIVFNYSGENSSTIILRTDPNANIIWTSTLGYLYSTESGGRFSSVKAGFLKNGNIALAERISIYDIDHPYQNTKDGYHLCGIDFISGSILWDNAFIYDASLSTRQPSIGSVSNVKELPNEDISFIASFADTAYYQFRMTKEVLNFTTDRVGRLKDIKGYSHEKPPLFNSCAVDAEEDGERLLLMDNADAPLMMKIDASGNVLWNKGYAKTGRSQETKSVLSDKSGNYFFSFTHNGGSQDLKMIKTDTQGNADCVKSDMEITVRDRTAVFKDQTTGLKTDNHAAKWYSLSAISIADYAFTSNVVCKKTCCEDVVSPVQKTDLCNAVSYTLPNGDVVSNSGSYDAVYKTMYGCDSIVVYKVTFSTSPVVELGPDKCFGDNDSLILKTEPGYEVYYWNGVPSDASSIVVKFPGQYNVRVTNACDTEKDSVTVFQECEFDIYMPTAFTPNYDGHNDYFRIPSQINNELVSFSIYNRWGQRVFFTKDKAKGWNGMLHEYPAASGTYVYTIVMRSLDGKKQITKRGWVSLLR